MAAERRGTGRARERAARTARDALSPGESRQRFIDMLGEHYEGFGVPRIGGRILALLVSSGEPVTPERICALLGVSRASVSTNLRLMASFGLLRKVSLKGERARGYSVSPTAWEAASRARVEGFERLAGVMREGLKSADGPAARRQMEDMLAWIELQRDCNREALESWRRRTGA